jgi:hypothetical protein
MSQNKGLMIAVVVLGVVAVAAVASSVTLWMMRSNGSASVQPPPKEKESQPAEAQNPPRSEAPAAVAPAAGATVQEISGVFINEKEISQGQVDELKRTYGAAPPKGHYWYDSRSGLYGYLGFESAGYIRPGHDFGTVSPQASRGNTGIFLNTRELNTTETQFFQKLFGAVYPGRYWLDGATGNIGVEGNPNPTANLVLAMQQAQRANQRSSEYHWRDGSGAVVSSDGNCTFAAIPGAPVYSNPGC